MKAPPRHTATTTISWRQSLALAFSCAAALASVFLLASRAEGEASAKIDRDPSGAPYIAGEILVSYEPGVPGGRKDSIVGDAGARTLDTIPEEDTRLVSFPKIKDESSAGERKERLRDRVSRIEDAEGVASVDYNYVRTLSLTPNDPLFGRQWGLARPGFKRAWDTTTGRGARISVIDSGITAHVDLRSKVLAQYDFGSGDRVAEDRIGHGTHVSGVASAATDNGVGVAGGCPECGLLVAKVTDDRGVITDAYLVNAISWSASRGADIINMSLGGPGSSDALDRAVNNATRAGVVVVAAAGNENTTRPSYPAAYVNAIAVSATTKADRRAVFSNKGAWVDVAAGGTYILSTSAKGGYRTASGTSFSSPHVAALAALLASEGRTVRQTRSAIFSSAGDLGPRGKDIYFGHGRIHAARAVS